MGIIREYIFGNRNELIDSKVGKVVNFIDRNDHNEFTNEEKFEIITRAMKEFVARKIKEQEKHDFESNNIKSKINELMKIKWKG